MKPDFNLDTVLAQVATAIAPYPKAAMFELAERGYGSVFEQLISCIISIRTLDETTIPVSLRVFDVARTPAELAELSPDELIPFALWHKPTRNKKPIRCWALRAMCLKNMRASRLPPSTR